MKTSGKVLIGVAVVVAGLVLAKNVIIKTVATQAIKKSTGFELELKTIKAGLFTQSFEINGMKLRNPPDFPDREAFDIDRIYVRYDLASFLSSTVHIHEIVVEIPQVVMVNKEDGESNLERMQANAAKKDEGKPQPGEPQKEEPAPEEPKPGDETVAKQKQQFMIDVLTLRLGKAEVRDYARAVDGKPKITTYNLNVDRTFRHVGSMRAIVTQITNQVLIEGGVKALTEQIRDSEKTGKFQKDLNKLSEKIGSLFKKKKDSE